MFSSGDERFYDSGGSVDKQSVRSGAGLRVLAAIIVAVVIVGWGAPVAQAKNRLPFVNQPLVPASTAPGGPGFSLTVNGTGFISGAVVRWNGSARATAFVNSSQLTVSILATDIASPSTATVTVVNPAPGGGASNA